MQCPSCQRELPDSNTDLICLHCGALLSELLRKQIPQPQIAPSAATSPGVPSNPPVQTPPAPDSPAPTPSLQSEAKPQDQDSNNKTKAKPKHVLLVEDDSYISNIYSIFLEKEGFTVIQAYDAKEADEHLEKSKFDLILLDIMLPDRSGLDILRDIRNNLETTSLPVIILSNIETEDVVHEAEALGADKYMVKARTSMHELAKEANSFVQKIKAKI